MQIEPRSIQVGTVYSGMVAHRLLYRVAAAGALRDDNAVLLDCISQLRVAGSVERGNVMIPHFSYIYIANETE